MSDEKTYNGWKNYETWNVALWIDNDQGTHGMRCEWAQEAWDSATPTQHSTRLESARYKLAETIKEWVEENNPIAEQCSMYTDLLGAALSEVDWDEIAGNWLDDVEKDEEAEAEESEVAQ